MDDERARNLDICIITPRPERAAPLDEFLRGAGHRLVVTGPDRAPAGTEWESFDLVLVDRDAAGHYPELPLRQIRELAALCEPGEIDEPAVLRSALRSGARRLLPMAPGGPFWSEALAAAAAASAPGAGTRVWLSYIDPSSNGERRVQLEDQDVAVGREPGNDIVFPFAYVSRRHARLSRGGGKWRLEDLGSRHGTLVNEARLEPGSPRALKDGDSIRLGGSRGPVIRFREAAGPVAGATGSPEGTGLFEGEGVDREVHDIAALLETFLSLKSDLVLEEILELVLSRAMEFVEAERGVILLRRLGADGSLASCDEPLSLAMARGRSGGEIGEADLRISQRIPADVLRSGQGVIFDDLAGSDAAAEHAATMGIGIRSAMCVPLKVRRDLIRSGGGEGAGKDGAGRASPDANVIGVLYVDSESRGRPFSPRALDALTVLAAEVATAIHSARLYEDSLRQRRHEEEMELARDIQRNIFEEIARAGDGWQLCGSTRPSARVGGDFISSFPLGRGGGFAALVGDVSGKGVPAALFATMLEGLFHGLLGSGAPEGGLEAAAAELNRFLLAKSRLQKFVTSIFGFLRPDGRFRYVNAGHNPGLLLRAGGEVEELEASGTILGMFEATEHAPRELECRPGDLLILYSDGLTESRDPAGALYGIYNLKRAAQSLRQRDTRGIHDGILTDFRRFVGEGEPMDDVTLLVIKRE